MKELETHGNFVIDKTHGWPQTSGTFRFHERLGRSLKSLGKKNFKVYYQSHPQGGWSMPVSSWTEKGAVVAAAKEWKIEASSSNIEGVLIKALRQPGQPASNPKGPDWELGRIANSAFDEQC